MSDLSIALSELVEKGSDVDALRDMLQFVAQRMMDADVEGRCGARNGYRDRLWETRAGAIVRLVGALLLEQNDEWQLQRRYMQLEWLSAESDNQAPRLSAVVND